MYLKILLPTSREPLASHVIIALGPSSCKQSIHITLQKQTHKLNRVFTDNTDNGDATWNWNWNITPQHSGN